MSPARTVAGDLWGLLACFAAAGIGFAWTRMGPTTWYPTLKKPPWTPADRVLGPVWSILSTALAVSDWLVWRRRGLAGDPS